jgi:hypothetical protein
VSPFPPNFARLIRAFHGIYSLLPGFSQRALLSTVRPASQEKKKFRDSRSLVTVEFSLAICPRSLLVCWRWCRPRFYKKSP